MNLLLSTRDESFLINLDLVMYLQADDHYTHVYYTTGTTFMVPFGLSVLEKMLSCHPAGEHFFRLGRQYIVNSCYVFHINLGKQALVLVDANGDNCSLHISKPMLRHLIEVLEGRQKELCGQTKGELPL